MAYSAVWSDAIPLGSLTASDIDQAIRDLRRDIHERMTDVLGIDWSTDPLVPGFVKLGTPNPALSGLIRVPNNQNVIVARNAANLDDIVLLKLNATDMVELANGKLIIDPATGDLSFTQYTNNIKMPAAGVIDIRSVTFGSIIRFYDVDAQVVIANGKLTLAAPQLGHAPIRLIDSAIVPTTLNDGDMWPIGDDLFRRIAGVTKKVTFV